MTTNFKGNFSATAIGSLPHTDADVACEIMFKSLPEIPCWPQLPKISTKEEMCILTYCWTIFGWTKLNSLYQMSVLKKKALLRAYCL